MLNASREHFNFDAIERKRFTLKLKECASIVWDNHANRLYKNVSSLFEMTILGDRTFPLFETQAYPNHLLERFWYFWV